MAIITQQIQPEASLREYVDSFWMLQNTSDEPKEVVVLPDGRVDLMLAVSRNEPFHINLMGLGADPDEVNIAPLTRLFSISFHPLAVEYILETSVALLLNSAATLPEGFWDFNEETLLDFDRFSSTASKKIKEHIADKQVDGRKQKLFQRIYESQGSATVKELSDQVHWSSRQINRYFNQQFGMSLKTYCEIIRFRASFHDLKEGKLFPPDRFTDQSHFIKQVKKLSGVSPKKLAQNQNDRFIQFFALKSK